MYVDVYFILLASPVNEDNVFPVEPIVNFVAYKFILPEIYDYI